MNSIGFLETLWHDLRHGARLLRLSPGFTAVAILSLALGIGANTAIFELIDAVRLRSLPIPNPRQLAEVKVANLGGGMGISNGWNAEITNPLWEQIRAHQQAFTGAFAWGDDTMRLGHGAEARPGRVLWVSGEFFPVLGVPPVLGRVFGPDDDRRGCGSPGAVISYGLWQSQFGGGESAVGSKLVVQDHTFEVIGITPARFFGLEVGQNFSVALPICSQAIWGDAIDRRDIWWLTVMGRLKPGWTLSKASAHLNAISAGLMEATTPTGYSTASHDAYRKLSLAAYPAGNGVSALRKTYDTSLGLLLGITGLVLLIACVNLANLMLARATAREREIAVRLALGATRERLISQLLSESFLLAAIGSILGTGLAGFLSQAIVRFLSTDGSPMPLDLTMDWRALSFAAAVAMVTCLVFGLAPALRSSRVSPGAAMKAGGRGLTAGRERFSFQRLLVISQISISLVLLVAAMLFVRSFRNLATLDPGFRTKGVLIAFVDPTRLHLSTAGIDPFQNQLLDRIRAIPRVEGAATTTNTPLNGSSWTMGIRVPGVEVPRSAWSKITWVSPGYFPTMEIPLLAGRDLNAGDTGVAPKVIVVNQTFARRYLGNQNPIGRTVRILAEPGYPEAYHEIVGVVRDTKYAGLRETIPPSSFIPEAQNPRRRQGMAVVIRSSASMSDLTSSLRKTLTDASADIEMDFRIFENQIHEGLARERLMAALSGFFGALAAILATVGLYGLISYIVMQRRNEIGIRVALGASRYQVVSLVVRESSALLAIGVAFGAALSLAAGRSAQSLLFGLKADDPLSLAAAAGLLAAIAALASYLPARRAAKVDPMSALRYE